MRPDAIARLPAQKAVLDSGPDGAARLGRTAGLESVLIGDIKSYGESINIDARLVDTETARVLAAKWGLDYLINFDVIADCYLLLQRSHWRVTRLRKPGLCIRL